MNERMKSLPTISSWLLKVTGTPARCHIAGSIVIAILVVATGWVSTQDLRASVTTRFQGVDVNLDDAHALILSSDGWRQGYARISEASASIEQTMTNIAQWLPTDIDPQAVAIQLRRLAAENGLTINRPEIGTRHVGTRVGVVTGRCEIHGNCDDVYAFLAGLPNQKIAIAVGELQLSRPATTNEGSDTDPCVATIEFRIPFAAEGTAAAQLLKLRIASPDAASNDANRQRNDA
ncbi:hypothetical protein Poly51_01690 [Rubripirellula tenax]|uniref:Uncharacterized protein n=1 Tax=Rubripirellula tenax TaxID=2528015 RepID=A0A5C6FDM9_9BACT|nr:hypothetical protein [Rubripirellula tenax]TWU59896.1 hypothetical protein Poly51_01690 [Rubripirellula tenax]